MKLSQLTFFCAVVEHGTIAAAAEHLHCVPSNITTRLKELEDTLGTTLFSREKNRLLITPQGRLLYRHATQLLQQAQETRRLFAPDAPPQGILRMGALDVALSCHLPRHIAQYRLSHPSVELHIRPEHSFELERLLVEGELDLIVTDGPIEHPLLASCLAFRERLVLITPHGIDVNAEQLSALELYVFGQSCYYRHQVDQWIGTRITPRQTLEIESYPSIMACVKAGLGFACVPESVLAAEPAEADWTRHALDDLPPSNIYFVWRKQQLSALVADFIAPITASLQASPS